MGRWLFLIFSFSVIPQLHGQVENWDSTGIPMTPISINDLFVDTVNNELYAAGTITIVPFVLNDQTLCKYDGVSWDTLGLFNHSPMTVIKHNGDIIVGGAFTEVSGIPANHIAKYNGASWSSFGDFDANPTDFEVIDGELYAFGSFNMVDGINMNGITKWNGTSWVKVFDFPYDAAILDIAKYQGELYIAGNFTDTLPVPEIVDMAVYSGGQWSKVGQGFGGGFTRLNVLKVYNDELYAAGLLREDNGNVGSMIQKWDGLQWSKVGDGLQGLANTNSSNAQVWDMVVYDSDLYVCGTFAYADHVPAQSVAKWNGSRWCGFGTDTLIHTSTALAFYNDTMYMGTIDSMGPLFVNHLAQWVGGSYVDTCGGQVGIFDSERPSVEAIFYPNPSSGHVTVQVKGAIHQEFWLKIYGLDGGIVFEDEITQLNQTFDLSALISGIYIAEITFQGSSFWKKLVLR